MAEMSMWTVQMYCDMESAAIFIGLMTRTYGFITDTGQSQHS
jgi:hypothetical protein